MASFWGGIAWALGPTIILGIMFWYVMRSIIHADRTERRIYSRMEAEERARRGMPQKP